MPKLVPVQIETLPPKNTKPIHQRLGERGSICESIHTSQMNLFQSKNFKAKQRRSVQNRLGKSWVNPVIHERNRIALHTLKSIVDNPTNMVQIDGDGLQLLNAFAKAIKNGASTSSVGAIQSADQKYDMAIQKEISMVQVRVADLFHGIADWFPNSISWFSTCFRENHWRTRARAVLCSAAMVLESVETLRCPHTKPTCQWISALRKANAHFIIVSKVCGANSNLQFQINYFIFKFADMQKIDAN